MLSSYCDLQCHSCFFFFLLDYVFPDFKYLERPYKTKLKKSIGQHIIKCGAGIWGAKKI